MSKVGDSHSRGRLSVKLGDIMMEYLRENEDGKIIWLEG